MWSNAFRRLDPLASPQIAKLTIRLQPVQLHGLITECVTTKASGALAARDKRKPPMLTQNIRIAALALAAGGMTIAAPAAAVPAFHSTAPAAAHAAYADLSLNYGDYDDDRRWGRNDRYERRAERRYERDQRRYEREQRRYERQQQRYWRGDDGRYYCRKSDGTTGLIVGGAAGALLGREIAGRNGDRTLGAILGAAGGALLGKSIDSKVTCR